MAISQNLDGKFPMRVSDYMRLNNALYYGARDPFGQKGDFITAPEISQIFGEIIAAFMLHIWQQKDQPQTNLIECGGGRGTLMADILRTAKPHGLLQKSTLHMIENSPALQNKQKETLHSFELIKNWHDNISKKELNNQFNILICNEFFDALEIDQYIYNDGQWHDHLIDNSDGNLEFIKGEAVQNQADIKGKNGDIYEISPARTAYMNKLLKQLNHNGVAIIIDYGSFQWGVGDTLQAVKDNVYSDPLANLGACDLTSHVNFNALIDSAESQDYYAHPLLTQCAFLNHLGGAVRAQKLDQMDAYQRLVAPDQMGDLFKVLIVASQDLKPIITEILL